MNANIAKIGAILFLIIIVSFVAFLIYRRESYNQFTQEAGYRADSRYYQKLGNGMVQCFLCPNQCILSPGQIGLCRARKNIEGELYSINYGKIASLHVDPIEKKPFFHFLPGSKAFSIAAPGCNLRCLYCQNWQIAQIFPWEVKTIELTPEELVNKALESGAESIAYTYSEPTAFFEYMLDTAKIAREKGLKNVVVTAGYISPEPLRELCQYVDAIKVDLKGFNEEFYRKITGARLQPVLEALKIIKEEGVWLEIVNLLIPGENDSEPEIRAMVKWIKENLGEDVPLHFSRFHPMYKLQNLPPTPLETIIRAREIALKEGLKYVYTGNVYYPEGEATYCPESGQIAIQRERFFVVKNNLKEGLCPSGEEIPGVWK